MASLLIDQFSFPSSGNPANTETYSIYFDNVAATLSLVYTGTDGVLAVVTYAQRGRLNGEVIGSFENAAGTMSYEVKSIFTDPFASISGSTPIDPPPLTCDLRGTAVATPVTVAGANNGTITVTATTTFPPVEYKLGAGAFQNSPVFNGLAAGEYGISLRDARGCQNLVVAQVAAYEDPLVSDSAMISKWTAAYNPIYLNFLAPLSISKTNVRMEVEITSGVNVVTAVYTPSPEGLVRADISAYLQVLVNARDQFKHNQLNYLDTDRAAAYTVRYRKVWDEAATVWFTAPGPRYVTYSAMQLSHKYAGNMVEYVPTQPGVPAATIAAQYSLNKEATVSARLTIASNNVEIVNVTANTSNTTNLAAGTSLRVVLRADTAAATASPWMTLIIRRNGVVIYRKTVAQNQGGQVLYLSTTRYSARYSIEATTQEGGVVPADISLPDDPAPTLAKFLTLFEEPTAWADLPFDLSFIMSEYLTPGTVSVRITSLDINRNPINAVPTSSYLLSSYPDNKILASEGNPIVIGGNITAPISNSALVYGLGINRLMIQGTPGQLVEYLRIQLYTGSAAAPRYVTAPIDVKVGCDCGGSYVYLKWINTLGGWDFWRFGYNQIMSITTADNIQVDRNVLDWSDDDTIADNINRNAIRKLAFGATVGKSKVEGLLGLHETTKVQMLISQQPEKWHTVIVAPGTFQIKRRRDAFADLKFTISLPETNIQRQ